MSANPSQTEWNQPRSSTPSSAPLIFLSAGEASGEAYGALLLSELQARCAVLGVEPRFIGMGGERMEAELMIGERPEN